MFEGFMAAMTGLAIRSLAILTAGCNFTHEIADFKTETHKLVTMTGPYR
jgi:hypothetical protein